MKKIDLKDYFQETTKLEFETPDGSKYIANVSGVTQLKLIELGKDKEKNSSIETMLPELFSIVFGQKESEELISKINVSGLSKIVEEIFNALGIKNTNDETKKQ